MPDLSWNEVRDRALAFSRRWEGEASEAAEKQTFWNEFFAVFGRDRRVVASFEVSVRNVREVYNHIDLLWRGVLLVEHKSAGKSLAGAESQAFAYIEDLARENRFDEIPRYVIVSDFTRFALYDLEPEEQGDLPLIAGRRYATTDFTLADLHRNVRHLAFLKGERTVHLDPEDPANQKAYDRMCQLHDELAALGFAGTDLERLLVRILFCVFADDTGVFDPETFETFVRQHTREDGSDVGARLNELFEILNTPEDRWPATARDTFAGFRYINGDLFKDRLAFPPFTRTSRKALLAACEFQWARVSPAVFGSLFQGVIDDKVRRQQGAHYTSERDIMKVVRSLFLDDLRAEFETIRADRSTRRKTRLDEFHAKLRSLRFLDPACGCGNFLVLGYRELRQLELDLLRERLADDNRLLLNVRDLIRVDVDQFFGIEYSEWPTRIAEVAMWLMDHQMNQRASEVFGQSFERLPLRSSPHIVQGNALRLDWRTVLPPEECSYVLGNPPFVGKKEQSDEQKADMQQVWRGVKAAGILDYVTCWYRKAADYIAGTGIRVAFVSTNSISQGEQVGVLWDELFGRWHLKIHFAHRTFPWVSEARGAAHVHVVIIGFGVKDPARKRLYEYDPSDGHATETAVPNINPYLIAGGDTTVRTRTRPINGAPPISYGSMMIDKDRGAGDEAGLILTREHRDALLAECPALAPCIRVLYGGDEFLNGIERWCLWLVDAPPKLLRESPLLRARIETVRRFRETSGREQTKNLARTPALFGEIRQPKTPYLLILKVSSENRRYIPIGFVLPKVIASGSALIIPGATTFHFGVLASAMHNVWLRTVGGRMKSDPQYSGNIVYNNYPWPENAGARRHVAVEAAAQSVLDARLPFIPPKGTSTFAELYDPLTMPAPLVRAHAALDRAVDCCYRSESFHSDRERVEHLFGLYERLSAPLLPEAPKPRQRMPTVKPVRRTKRGSRVR